MSLARRILLAPLSWLYRIGVGFADLLYIIGVKKAKVAPVRTVCIGNLTVGGTGKTPVTEYFIGQLQDKGHNVAMLSRGYRRRTKGLQVATPASTSQDIGDEPMQIHKRYPDIPIVVDGDRNRALEYIKANMPEVDVVLMDDGMQHKSTIATEYVLVCDYARPIYDDTLLPAGNLRESWSARRKAKTVIINKCPLDLSQEERLAIEQKMRLNADQRIFFTAIEYKNLEGTDVIPQKVLSVAGIGRPEPFFDEVRRRYGNDTECIAFADHHNFTEEELKAIENKLDLLGKDSVLVCTEKDAQRLSNKIGTHSVCYIRIGLRILFGGSLDIL